MIAQHGGDVWRVAEEFGIPVEEILDFSANINPRGLPRRAMERLAQDASNARMLGAYPDPAAVRLREALSLRDGVPAESIVVGPGAEALLAPILRVLDAKRVVVQVPAFSEYRRVCNQLDIEYSQDDGDVAILNNPHNPSGGLIPACEVRRAFQAVKARRGKMLVDEAFIDYVPYESIVKDAVRERGLIVLRSLTKFYGCPALRVGYAVGHAETIQRVRDLLPTWPVTQLAMDTLAEAVADHEFAAESIRENEIERERVTEALRGLGLRVSPSSANFLLVKLEDGMPSSSELRRRLIEKHRILIRNCDSYEGLEMGRYLRVAVRSGEENGILLKALQENVST